MPNYARDIRNSAWRSEGEIKKASAAAQSSARSNAQTAQAAQSTAQSARSAAQSARSAAAGTWVGAGFQMVTAMQTARAARAAEEQVALQQAMAEQEKLHQFAMWRQTPDGVAFVQWRDRAVGLGQMLRDRDSEWLQSWARAIGRAQSEIPGDEIQRFVRRDGLLRQTGLKVAAILCLCVAALFSLGLLATNATSAMLSEVDQTYADCLKAAGDNSNPMLTTARCEAIKPNTTGPIIRSTVLVAIPLGASIALFARRKAKIRAVRADHTLADEAQARVRRWGFDPLMVTPGYTGFPWYLSQDNVGYADRLMNLALHGHTSFPARSSLPALYVPESWPPSEQHPAEVNELLARWQHE